MFTKSTIFPVLSMLLLASGCGKWPPVVNSRDDIERLPASQNSVRARGLADSDIPSLARFKGLRTLDFSGGSAVMPAKITDEGLGTLAKLDLPALDTLTLGKCDELTDAGLAHLGQMKQSITWLGLTACPKITNAGLRELTNAKNLTGLDLRGCPNITDAGIQQLADKTNWKEIQLGGCPKVTPQGVAKLQAALPNARIVKDDKEWEEEQSDARARR